MASFSKVVGVIFWGFLRCLELSTATQADNVAAAADQRKLTKLIGGQAVKRGGRKANTPYGGRRLKRRQDDQERRVAARWFSVRTIDSPARCAVESYRAGDHAVAGPDMIGILRPEPDTGAIRQPESPARRLFLRHLQTFAATDLFDPFVV
jgi:hypothetical protein